MAEQLWDRTVHIVWPGTGSNNGPGGRSPYRKREIEVPLCIRLPGHENAKAAPTGLVLCDKRNCQRKQSWPHSRQCVDATNPLICLCVHPPRRTRRQGNASACVS